MTIYHLPEPDAPIDQGDILEGCPILQVAHFNVDTPDSPEVSCSVARVVVISQACDLVNQKTTRANVALVFDAEELVERRVIRAGDVRGPIRSGRVYGWYFLPSSKELGFQESIADLRQLHTVPLNVLADLAGHGFRKARIRPLYREHLAKHFADTFSRIGLPQPYETDS